MTDERKTQLALLRNRLKSLTPAQRQAMIDRGLVATIEGRTLSVCNTILVYLQSTNTPTVVGGFKQWLKANRVVQRGQHGITIWFPIGNKDEDGNILEADKYYTATVFDISQTEELKPHETPVMPAPTPVIAKPIANKPIPEDDKLMAGFQLV